MRRLRVALVLGVLLSALVVPYTGSAQDRTPVVDADWTCAPFDAWEWAQSVFESDPVRYAALDPDGDGIVCPGLPHGFAPAFWLETIPLGVERAKVTGVIDSNTVEIELDGDLEPAPIGHASEVTS